MLSEVRQKKIMEKLNRTQKCSILGPQNLGSGGGPGPRGPPWIRTWFSVQIGATVLWAKIASVKTHSHNVIA